MLKLSSVQFSFAMETLVELSVSEKGKGAMTDSVSQ